MSTAANRLKASLMLQLKARGLPLPTYGDNCREPELTFAKPRKWRFDYAWPEVLIALEIDGGVRGKSRHFSAIGFYKDQEKMVAAACLGWFVVHTNYWMIEKGYTVDLLKIAFKSRRK